MQRAKKIVAGVFRGAIQHFVEICFQGGSLVLALLAAEEHIEIPTNPGGNLFFPDVEEKGQRPALKRDGQIMHRLDGIPIQRLREQALQQRLDPGHDTRVLGTEKKRLHDLPILRVFRRVGLQRNLPHCPEVFLRWNRHAKGIIGTECLPVLGRFAYVRVAQDHADFFITELLLHCARLFSRFTERVGVG